MLFQTTRFLKRYAEPILWSGALVLLFFMDVSKDGASLCVLKAIGISWCPGCGIGHSIHHALHLNFATAMHEHVLGIPATTIILYQIFKSLYITHKNYKYGPATNYYDVS